MQAYAMIYNANEDTLFNICFDNEWKDQLTKEQALEFIIEYEQKQTHECKDLGVMNKDEWWKADVMCWFISKSEDNTIVMTIL